MGELHQQQQHEQQHQPQQQQQQDNNYSNEMLLDSFVASGRTGRRNALADLGVENAMDPALLADRLTQQLSTSDNDTGQSSSKMVVVQQHQQVTTESRHQKQQQEEEGYANK